MDFIYDTSGDRMNKSTVVILLAVLAVRGAEAPDVRWQAVADRLITTPVDSYPFDWGEGVQMIGLMKAYERTRNTAYLDYMEKWTALWKGRSLDELLNTGAAAKGPRPGYCGYWSPATAILLLSEHRRKPEYTAIAEGVTAFIRNGAERNPADGALGHWQGSHQLWVDTLYMACPLLSAMSVKKKDVSLAEDAAGQILSYAKALQNSDDGLFYHMWDWRTGERSPSLWGRGNGWVVMSIADTLEVLPANHARVKPLREVAVRLARGLKATQDSDGLWRTVMDEPGSYPESSATAMSVYGLLKLVRLGAIGSEFSKPARKAWSAINARFVKDGLVVGASAGTDPGASGHYKAKPVGVQTWGTGAYLLAASEVSRLEPVKLR